MSYNNNFKKFGNNSQQSYNPLVENRRRDQTSHIFTGEDPSTVKETQKKHVQHLKSNVVFNDSYYETNPKINPQRYARYNFEQRYKRNAKFSDELVLSEGRKKLLERKINDNYKCNPMKIMNKEENDKYNRELALKNQKHAQAFNKVMGSDGCKRVLGGIKRNKINYGQNDTNKVTNNDFHITQKSIMLNKDENNQVPYYGRRHFRYASTGDAKGHIFLE